MIRFDLPSACFYFLQVNNQWQKLGGTSGEGADLTVHALETGQYAEEIGGKEDSAQMQKGGEKTSGSPTVSDETTRGTLVKGGPEAGVFRREGDETVYGLKQKGDEVTADSNEKGGENGSSLKKEDDRGGEAAGDLNEKEHEAAGDSLKEENDLKGRGDDGGEFDGGLKEAGDEDGGKNTGGCLQENREAAGVQKDDQVGIGSNEIGEEYGGSGKETVDESVCTSKDESNVSDGGLKKSDQGAGGSKEKRNEATAIAASSLKEKEEVIDGAMKNGDEVAGGSNDEDKGASGSKERDGAVSGSGEKVVARNPGGARGGEVVDSSNQNSDKSGNDNDEWTTSSNGNQAEDTIVVVLHAFIQPDAWDIDSDIQYDVHVRSEYLKWKTNCATVTVRYVGVTQCLLPLYGSTLPFVQMSWQHLVDH